MFPGRPTLRWSKTPFSFTRVRSCHSRDAEDLKDIAQKRVVERTVEPDHKRIPGSRLGLGKLPQRGIQGPAFVRAHSEVVSERLGQEPSLNILELAVDDERIMRWTPSVGQKNVHS